MRRLTGAIDLSVQQHSPLYAEFDRNTTLSQRLIDTLASQRFVITQDKTAVPAQRGLTARLGSVSGLGRHFASFAYFE